MLIVERDRLVDSQLLREAVCMAAIYRIWKYY